MVIKKAKENYIYLSDQKLFDLSVSYNGNIFGYSNKVFNKLIKNNLSFFNLSEISIKSINKYKTMFLFIHSSFFFFSKEVDKLLHC